MKNMNFPEGSIKRIIGSSLTIQGSDIDTDRIIPARFLKCVSFNALGQQVFADDRFEMNGRHPFDLIENQGASILIVNDNFGCGSSREHAPQALMRWGIRAIIGQSFAEIFFGNCLALGIPCATTSFEEIANIQKIVDNNKQIDWQLELTSKSFKSDLGEWKVDFETSAHEMLTTGRWDATSQLIAHDKDIIKTVQKLPYLNDFNN